MMEKQYTPYKMRVFLYVLANGSCASGWEVAKAEKDSNTQKYCVAFEDFISDGSLVKNAYGRYVFSEEAFNTGNPDMDCLKDEKVRKALILKMSQDPAIKQRLENPFSEASNHFFNGRLSMSEPERLARLNQVIRDYKKK